MSGGPQLPIVGADEGEVRLDRWLRRHFSHLPQALIEKLCRTGQVRVDGKRVSARARLAPGQTIRLPPLALAPLAPISPPDPLVLKELERLVLYRDASVLVLNKPAGLPVQGGPGITRHLDRMVEALARDGLAPRLVHRLDRDTAGVLVLARDAAAAGKLAAAFRTHRVRKTYWAVVVGCPVPQAGRIDLPLARTHNPRFGRTALADATTGKRAVTDYATLDRVGDRFAWLELTPATGRTHQLRVHCAALGTPILGDPVYGQDKLPAVVEELPQTLHLLARAIAFPHPEGGWLTVEAPLPKHFVETFAALGFTAPRLAKPQRETGREMERSAPPFSG